MNILLWVFRAPLAVEIPGFHTSLLFPPNTIGQRIIGKQSYFGV